MALHNYQTRMGHTFYEHTMPAIARELQRLNGLLERIAVVMEQQGAPQGERKEQGQQCAEEVHDDKAET